MLQYLVFVGAGISLLAALFYIRDTLNGDTKPNRVTFFMWSVAPLIATAAAIAKGVTWAVIPVFMSGFCPFLVFLSSFANPKAYWKLGTFDYLCGICSVVTLVLWAVTRQPDIAIGFAIASDGLAAVPTIRKSWSYPETETGIVYLAGFASALTSFAAMRTWAFSEYAFPVYLIIANALIATLLYGRRSPRSQSLRPTR